MAAMMAALMGTGVSADRVSTCAGVPSRAAMAPTASRTAWAAASASASMPRRSTHSSARPGITLMAPGDTFMTAAVPTTPRPARFVASSRTARTTCAAVTSASRRPPMGVVPECAAVPSTVTLSRMGAAMASTTPTGMPACSSTGPCSMCSSTKALSSAGRRAHSPRRSRSSPSAARACASVTPPWSCSVRQASRRARPAMALLPRVPTEKRADSSPRKQITSSGCRRGPAPRRRRTAARPPTTPTTPSKFPPSGTVSRCEPVATAGASRASPSSRPTRLPKGSRRTASPASRMRPATYVTAADSASPNTSRLKPRAPLPNRPMPSSVAATQARSMVALPETAPPPRRGRRGA